jgi:hypothetical protein
MLLARSILQSQRRERERASFGVFNECGEYVGNCVAHDAIRERTRRRGRGRGEGVPPWALLSVKSLQLCVSGLYF